MAEVREVPVPVETRHRSGALPLLMFVLGALLIAIVVLMLLDVHWTISWPAGHVDIGLRPITQSADSR
jgi:hypothetical protein